MGTFSKNVILNGDKSLIPTIAGEIERDFMEEGYEVMVDELKSGSFDISITKGGSFKAVLGMRTALKINLIPLTNGINLKADVGIWGQQAVPFAISMLLFWPVILTQIWGLVKQAKLDDKTVEIAERVIRMNSEALANKSVAKFCRKCGAKIDHNAKFCPSCGEPL